MSNPTLAPRISNSALVVIVVPCAKNSICEGGIPSATKLARPSSTPSAGFFGVLATFATASSPVSVSSTTSSVCVPPTSTPRRYRQRSAVTALHDASDHPPELGVLPAKTQPHSL